MSGNALVCGDNLDILRELPDECVDLIYLDPPFNSNQFYVAAFGDKGTVQQQLRDVWRWTEGTERAFQNLPRGKLRDCLEGIRFQTGKHSKMAAYAVYMGRRLLEMHRLLRPTGSIYLHCDPHANAYLRVVMDSVFGSQNFRNEVVWKRSHAHSSARRYGPIHDTLLFYSKTSKYLWTNHRQTYDEAYEKRYFKFDDGDGRGKYWTGDLTGSGTRRGETGNEWRGFNPTDKGRHWMSPPSVLDQLDVERRIYWPKTPGAWPKLKRFLGEAKGVPLQDVIDDIYALQTMGATTGERLGYPTQKPLALLERIIQASSNPGDMVLDPFCGCGTTADAAAFLERKYLGIDISSIAVNVMEQRLTSRGKSAAPTIHRMSWADVEWEDFESRALQSRDDSEDGTPGWYWAEDRVAGLLKAIPNEKKVGDGGVDARFFGAKDTKQKKQIVVPIQVKMHRDRRSVGRPDMDRLLGVQTSMNNQGSFAPMSLMISLYPPSDGLRRFAAEQGRIKITTSEEGAKDYPRMQVLSVQEILQKGEWPKLPPQDPRALVGDTQTRMGIA